MRRFNQVMGRVALLVLMGLSATFVSLQVDAVENYLYYRDANVPPFQKSREFFDMPDRSGHYEVSLVSESVGPLTFRIVRIRGDHETTFARSRSYHVGNHEFHARFDNPEGSDDLIVEISNSNPAVVSKVTVIVVELPNP